MTTDAAGTTLVLDPELRYADLADRLGRLGFAQVRGPASAPLVPGEPEFATWRRGADLVVYTCNPVAWLRLLDLSGVATLEDRVAVAVSLPPLDLDTLPALLRSSSSERVLLGVLACAAVGAVEHLSAIRALTHHRDPAVAQAAVGTVRTLVAR